MSERQCDLISWAVLCVAMGSGFVAGVIAGL